MNLNRLSPKYLNTKSNICTWLNILFIMVSGGFGGKECEDGGFWMGKVVWETKQNTQSTNLIADG